MATNFGKVKIEMDQEVREVLERFTKAAEDFAVAIIAAGEAIKQFRIAAELSAQQSRQADATSSASNDAGSGTLEQN